MAMEIKVVFEETAQEMAVGFENLQIPDGYLKPDGTLVATQEGVYDVAQYASADFSVQKQQASIIPTQETQTITPSEKAFFDKVVVEAIPSEYIVPNGVLAIDRNGEYDVASYAQAVVNTPDLSGVPIEVSELPEATADTVNKVYFVDKKVPIKLGDVIGDKLYFDTTKDPMDYLANAVDYVTMLEADIDPSDWQCDITIGANVQRMGDGYLCMLAASYTNGGDALLYVNSNVLTVEQYNQEVAGIGLPPVTEFGWQVDETDTSSVKGATVSYVGEGAEVIQIDDGSLYYLGAEKNSFAVGTPLGDKIRFDTTKNPADFGIPPGEMAPVLTAQSDSASFGIVVGEILGGGSGLCYLVACGDISSDNLSSVNIVYVQSDAPTVDQFNELIGPQFGFTVTHFGWQTDVVDTSAFADCIVQENLLPLLGNFAYGEKYSFDTVNGQHYDNIIEALQSDVDWANLLKNNIREIHIPAGTTLTNGILARCTNIAKISFAEHKPYQFSNAFGGKASVPSSLKTLEMTAENINQNEFRDCKSLTTVIIRGVKFWGKYAFMGCDNLENVIISASDYIGIYTFNDCHKISNVIIGNGLTKLETGAFDGCDSLTSIVIPDSVTNISNFVFRDCVKLEDVTIGTGITSISYGAFSNCVKLKSITIKATTPPSIQIADSVNDTFNNCPALTAIYVPAASVEAYKSATNWSAYADIIKSINEGSECGAPIEVATSAEMDSLLVEENIGNVYKYIGETTDTYKQNTLYIVEEA